MQDAAAELCECLLKKVGRGQRYLQEDFALIVDRTEAHRVAIDDLEKKVVLAARARDKALREVDQLQLQLNLLERTAPSSIENDAVRVVGLYSESFAHHRRRRRVVMQMESEEEEESPFPPPAHENAQMIPTAEVDIPPRRFSSTLSPPPSSMEGEPPFPAPGREDASMVPTVYLESSLRRFSSPLSPPPSIGADGDTRQERVSPPEHRSNCHYSFVERRQVRLEPRGRERGTKR